MSFTVNGDTQMTKDTDCTFETGLGKFNYRVGLIIYNGRRVLMARNPNEKRRYYYSVGGRVRFGETLEQAAFRELREETGISCGTDRLVCIHENFFTDERGVFFHEVSCYFTVKTNDRLLSIRDGHRTCGGPEGEYLEWIDLDDCGDTVIYPEILRTVDFRKDNGFRHIISGR